MAELQARLKPKVCGYSGVKPALSDLELGEIVLNTADAVFYTRHVDDTVKTIGAGLIDLGDLQDVDTSTAAPTDKQVLSWNATDSLWTPRTISYNDLADQPTLAPENAISKIQDAEDFKPNIGLPRFYSFNFNSGKQTPNEGDWTRYITNTIPTYALSSVDANGNAVPLPGDGENPPSWWSIDGGATWTQAPNSPWYDISGSSAMKIFIDGYPIPFNDTFTLLWSFDNPLLADALPLYEGDLIQWDNTAQAFRPVQLDPVFSGDYNDLANTPDLSLKADLVGGKVPADQLPAIAVSEFLGTVADEAAMLALTGQSGDWCVRVDTDSAWILSADDASVLANWIELGGGAGNVVSVNDKTGAVSLGIQDMDDYAPQLSAGSTWNHTSDSSDNADVGNTGATNGKVTTDQAGASYNQYTLWVGDVDSDGINRKADMLQAIADGAVLSVYYDGVLAFTDSVTSPGGVANQYGRVALSFTGGSFFFPPTIGTVVGLSLPGSPPLALVQGDILQWNTADQKFKPAQLETSSSWNDLTDKPTEFPPEAHTHRIQDADDYKPQLEPSGQPIGEWEFRGTFNSLCSRPGDAAFSDSWVGVAFVDLYGDNHEDALAALIGSTTWMEFAGVRRQVNLGWPASISAGGCRLQWDRKGMAISYGDRLKIWAAGVTPPAADVALPPAKGDVLQWDEVDQKFKPTQLPAIPAVPVDSVNGQTGVVSLGIQDMDDFELNPAIADFTELTNLWSKSSSVPPNAGDWFVDPDSNWNYLTAHRSHTELLALQIGDFVTLSAGGVTFDATLTQIPYLDSNVNWTTVRWNFDQGQIPQAFKDLPVGSALTVTSARFTTGFVQLAQGDVLSWDDGIKKFTPEQLNLPASYVTSLDDLDDVDTTTVAPADKEVLAWDESQLRWMPRTDPAAPVQSVQGKTGDVRLSIQDMDDFELNRDTSKRWRFTSVGYNVYPITPGGWSPFSTTVYFQFPDQDGTNGAATASAYDYSQGIFVSTDGINFSLVTGVTKTSEDGNYFGLDAANWGPAQGQIYGQNPQGDLFILLEDPGAAVDMPLAEGDLLQWSDAEQAFQPGQLSYNDLADQPVLPTGGVESINNLDGVVTFGMNDLNDVVSDYTPTNRAEWTQLAAGTPTNRAPKSPGQWGYFEGGESNRQLRLNYVDGNGNPWADAMVSLPPSGTLYISQDDVRFLALPYRAKAHNAADGYLSFFVDPYVPPKVDGSLFVSLEPPESPIFQPFAQGSHLEFTGALWQPVQLATVAKSGSYNDLDDKPVIPVPNARVSDGFLVQSLLAGDTTNGWLDSAGKAGMFISVKTDRPAWVRFYTDPISRADDVVNRQAMDENPTRGSGVLLEVITDGTSTYSITPVVNYFNNELPEPQGRLAVAITNTDATTARDIQLTVEVLVIET